MPSTDDSYSDLTWADFANCVGETDLFFEHRCSTRCNRHPLGCDRLECVRKAKEVCMECPVLEHCRIWAIEAHLQHGVAGAMSERERLEFRRQYE
ncbi:WhiB family transcriptional regulator [Candidatus Bathyarchaeota archaeon]|nr:WhiB family transcriptional regulator [Candidatus Bathyarchaeota archaeon]